VGPGIISSGKELRLPTAVNLQGLVKEVFASMSNMRLYLVDGIEIAVTPYGLS
jgi:hypothetical protein